MAGTLTCRPMRRPELDLAPDWDDAEGWSPGLHDADAFWAADPGGFRLAEAAGMAPVFETARMDTRTPPPVRDARVFGVTTFELG